MNLQAIFINSLYLLGIILALMFAMTLILAGKDMIDRHRHRNICVSVIDAKDIDAATLERIVSEINKKIKK